MHSHTKPSRRSFLQTAAASSASLLLAPSLNRARGDLPKSGKLRFGLIADVHQDVMHDGVERITAFVQDMTRREARFVINLGDFCVPHARNNAFLAAWNQFKGDKYHVMGNHDTDGGYKREQTVEYYGMPSRYYSFDQHGVHFIVLDGNDPDGKTRGYQRFVADDQLLWLTRDLAKTKLPTIVNIHQPIDCYDKSVINAAKVREVLAKANAEAGFQKVIAVFAGHQHLDYVKVCDDIPHVQINSASYVWVNVAHPSYDAAILKKHPSIARTCPYVDPLWAMVTLDFEKGGMEIAGRESQWKGADPWEVGLKEDAYQRSRELSRPAISDRQLKLAGR